MAIGPLQGTPQSSPLCHLPPELIVEIMGWLPAQPLLAAGTTCKFLRGVSQVDILWRKKLGELPPGVSPNQGLCYAAYVAICQQRYYDANIRNGICVRTRVLQGLVMENADSKPEHALAANATHIFRSRGCLIDYLNAHGSVIEIFKGHTCVVSALAAEDDTLISTSIMNKNSSEMRIWKLDSSTVCVRTIPGRVTALALKEGECFMGCGNTIMVLNIENGHPITQWDIDASKPLPITFLALDEKYFFFAREKSGSENRILIEIRSRSIGELVERIGSVDTDVACPGIALHEGRFFSQLSQDGMHVICKYNYLLPMPDLSEKLPGPGGSFLKVHRFAMCGLRFINSFASAGVYTHKNEREKYCGWQPGWKHDAIEIREYHFPLTYALKHVAAQISNSAFDLCIALDTFKGIKGKTAHGIKENIFNKLYLIHKWENVVKYNYPDYGKDAFFDHNGLHSTREQKAKAILLAIGSEGMQEHVALVRDAVCQNALQQQILEGTLYGKDSSLYYPKGRKWRVVTSSAESLPQRSSTCALL